MASKLKTYYIGAIVERDTKIFKKIIEFAKVNFNLKVINLLKKKKFSVRYFKKKLKKYPISLIVIKLFTEEKNQKIFEAIGQYAAQIPLLNSSFSIQTCGSRRSTFKLIEENCNKLKIPQTYYSINSALDALKAGKSIIVKHDVHHIKHFSKYDRIVGVAKTKEEFLELLRKYDVQNNQLFFQEYLGKFNIVYKVYIIDGYIQTITSKHLMRNDNPTLLELVHMRVPIDKKLKKSILKIGEKFGMECYGVDYVLKDGKPYVVDINDFPSYRNIPEAISLIANNFYKILERHDNLESLSVKSAKT